MIYLESCHHCGGKLQIKESLADEYRIIRFWCPDCRSMVYVGTAEKGDKKALERAAKNYNKYVSEKWRTNNG